MRTHLYQASVHWTPDPVAAPPARASAAWSRSFLLEIPGKPNLPGSSDPAFHGDPTRHNPEDLLLSAVASCHMLSYLYLADAAGLRVTAYTDSATATLQQNPDGSADFTRFELHPAITLSGPADLDLAAALHPQAHQLCFIARAVRTPITILPHHTIA